MSSRGAAKKLMRAVQLQAKRLQKQRLGFMIMYIGRDKHSNRIEKIRKAFVKVFCGRVEADWNVGRSACAKLS